MLLIYGNFAVAFDVSLSTCAVVKTSMFEKGMVHSFLHVCGERLVELWYCSHHYSFPELLGPTGGSRIATKPSVMIETSGTMYIKDFSFALAISYLDLDIIITTVLLLERHFTALEASTALENWD